jgi:hypothetical protein
MPFGSLVAIFAKGSQTYRRVPIDFDRAVVAWEFASSSNASQKKRNDSQVASRQASFLLIDIGHLI